MLVYATIIIYFVLSVGVHILDVTLLLNTDKDIDATSNDIKSIIISKIKTLRSLQGMCLLILLGNVVYHTVEYFYS